MSISERKTNLSIGIVLALSLIIVSLNAPISYAAENTQEKGQTTIPSVAASSSSEDQTFIWPDYQGKENLKDCWDSVLNYRSEISDIKVEFEGLEPGEEWLSQANALVEAAKKETDLATLESIKTQLTNLLDEWTKEALAAAGIDAEVVASSYASQGASGGSYYASAIQSGILTRSGGVNSFGGRTETWYSQRVLPGGGLNIPGRYVAADGTIRDADGYIVVAASDLAYGSTVETSLGTGKVYDTGCASGVTDVYTDW